MFQLRGEIFQWPLKYFSGHWNISVAVEIFQWPLKYFTMQWNISVATEIFQWPLKYFRPSETGSHICDPRSLRAKLNFTKMNDFMGQHKTHSGTTVFHTCGKKWNPLILWSRPTDSWVNHLLTPSVETSCLLSLVGVTKKAKRPAP